MLSLRARVDKGAIAMKVYSSFSNVPDCLVSYSGHSLEWGWGLTPLQRCGRCILQPEPTGQECVLLACLFVLFYLLIII